MIETATMTHLDLRRYREESQVTQNELAWELGISIRSIQRFEYGEYPLPRRCSNADYLEAVRRIAARKQDS